MFKKLQDAVTGAVQAAKGVVSGNTDYNAMLSFIPDEVRPHVVSFVEENIEKIKSGELNMETLTSELEKKGVSKDQLEQASGIISKMMPSK